MVKAFKNYSQIKDFVLRENLIARYTIGRLHRLLPHPLDNKLENSGDL
jgi:hypothetical protein